MWHRKILSDVIGLQRGYDLPSPSRHPGSVPIIGSFGITGYHDAAKHLGPGVAIGRSGASIGKASYVQEAYWPLNTCLFVTDFKGNSPRWVFHLLDQIDFTQFNSGSAQPSLNRNHLTSIEVNVPPVQEQYRIAAVISAFDDKIGANTRIAQNADDLAMTIYRSVSAHSSAGAPVATVASLTLGGTPDRAVASYWIDGEIPWINSGAANATRIFEPNEWITKKALRESATKLMRAGTTVVAITGATLGQIARLEIEACGNQSLVGVLATDPRLNDWIHFALRSERVQLVRGATGAAQQHINKRDVQQLEIPLPDEDQLGYFNKVATPLLGIAGQAGRESLDLERLRDLLLPALMTGRVLVSDGEHQVEDAD